MKQANFRRLAAASLIGALLIALGVTVPAAAQEDPQAATPAGRSITIDKIDTRSFPDVNVTFTYTGTEPDGFTVTENGEDVRAAVTPGASTSTNVALVIDTSGAMTTADGQFEAAKAAAIEFAQAKPDNQRIAVIATGADGATLTQPLTSDTSLITRAIEQLGAGGDTHLWDGIRIAAAVLDDAGSEAASHVVVVNGSEDRHSTVSATSTFGVLTAAKATATVVALPGADPNVQALAGTTGGTVVTADASNVSDYLTGTQSALQAREYSVEYASPSPDAEYVEIAVSGGGQTATAGVQPGFLILNPQPLASEAPEPFAPGLFTGPLGLGVALAGIAAGLGLAAYAIAAVLSKGETDLASRLDQFDSATAVADDAEKKRFTLSSSSFLKKAAERTSEAAEKSGRLDRIEQKLESADINYAAGEFIVMAAGVILAVALVLLLLLGPLFAVVFLVAGLKLPDVYLDRRVKKRKKKFTSQLPDTLNLLSSSLKAGYALLQGVEAVGEEMPDPMGSEMRRIMSEARLGAQLDHAFDDSAKRVGSLDYDWAVMAIKIQREVGGNLAELLQSVGETMIERERLRRDVSTLTAEGRMSAYILAALPIGLGAFMFLSNPDYAGPLISTTIGKGLIAASAVLLAIGLAWMMKIINIKV